MSTKDPKKKTSKKGVTNNLLLRQAWKESSFRADVENSLGFKGLGQLGDAVISDYKKANKIKNVDPFDPKQAKAVQKWYMNNLYNSTFANKSNSSEEARMAKALAAYNWGRGNVAKTLTRLKKEGKDTNQSIDWIEELPNETSDYIKKILGKDEGFNKVFDSVSKLSKYKNILDVYEHKPLDEIPTPPKEGINVSGDSVDFLTRQKMNGSRKHTFHDTIKKPTKAPYTTPELLKDDLGQFIKSPTGFMSAMFNPNDTPAWLQDRYDRVKDKQDYDQKVATQKQKDNKAYDIKMAHSAPKILQPPTEGPTQNNDMKKFNYGGALQEFNVGGTHESNPLGGIPIGNNSSVEQGEAMKDGEVFSNRPEMVITKDEAIKNALGKKAVGKTPSEYVRELNKQVSESAREEDRQTFKEQIERTTAFQDKRRQLLEGQSQQQQQQLFWGGLAGGMGGAAGGASGAASAGGAAAAGGGMGNIMGMGTQALSSVGSLIGSFTNKKSKGPVDNGPGALAPNPNQHKKDPEQIGDPDQNQAVDSIKDTASSFMGPMGTIFRGAQKGIQALGKGIGGGTGAAISGLASPEEATMANLQDSELSTGQKLLGTIPGVGGIIARKSAMNKANKKEANALTKQHNLAMRNYKYGGAVKNYALGGGRDPWGYPIKSESVQKDPMGYPIAGGKPPLAGTDYNNLPQNLNTDVKGVVHDNNPTKKSIDFNQGPNGSLIGAHSKADGTDKKEPWLNKERAGDIGNSLLRGASPINNALQAMNLKDAEVERLDKMTARHKPARFDRQSAYNTITNSFNPDWATEMSGGSLGRATTLGRAQHIDRLKAISDAEQGFTRAKIQDNQFGEQFDAGVSRQNISQSNLEKDWNARNRAAYDNNKSMLWSAFAEDLGEIGLENTRKDYPERMGLDYDWRGEYRLKKQKEKEARKAARLARRKKRYGN